MAIHTILERVRPLCITMLYIREEHCAELWLDYVLKFINDVRMEVETDSVVLFSKAADSFIGIIII